MSQHLFTKEEQNLLAANQYTFRVSDKQLSFTAEFKALFWEEYCTGTTPAQILRKYGYPTEILGASRITGIQRQIKKESQKADGFFLDAAPRQRLPIESCLMPSPSRNALTSWSKRCCIWNSRWSS